MINYQFTIWLWMIVLKAIRVTFYAEYIFFLPHSLRICTRNSVGRSFCYNKNGKYCSCATIELWMHLEGLLSTQEAYSYSALTLLSCLETSHVYP